MLKLILALATILLMTNTAHAGGPGYVAGCKLFRSFDDRFADHMGTRKSELLHRSGRSQHDPSRRKRGHLCGERIQHVDGGPYGRAFGNTLRTTR